MGFHQSEDETQEEKMSRKKTCLGAMIFSLVVCLGCNSLWTADNPPEEKTAKPGMKAKDVTSCPANLILNKDIAGKIFIRDERDDLVLELTKPFGRKIELNLDGGEYWIINVVKGDIYKADIVLKEGESFKLSPYEFMRKDRELDAARKRMIRERRETILKGQTRIAFFAEIGTKTTTLHGETALLMGGNFGATFNHTFSVGVAGYGKANFDPGLPGYGGITLAYTFMPERMIHIRATALAGSGTARVGGIFYIFEPGLEMVLNLSRIVRIQVGLSYPLVDKEFCEMDNLMLNIGFQFGK